MSRNVTVLNQSTGSSTKGSFKYVSAYELSLEIGVTNRAGSLVTTLGMEKGRSGSASISMSIGNRVNAKYWVTEDFNIYDYWCQN